jgi:hypothetical protein
MKYAKSDKGYYVPKGQGGAEAAGSNAGSAMPDPVRGETSLSFEDAGYTKTKDKYGNEMFVPKPGVKSGYLDYQAAEGESMHMKTVGYVKNPDGTFKPVVYDMKSRNVDDLLTKELGPDIAGGMQLAGGTNLNSDAVGKLLYKNSTSNYQGGAMGKVIEQSQKNPGQIQYIPTTPIGKKWDVNSGGQQ